MYIHTPAKPVQQLVAPLQVRCQISANLWKKKKCNFTKCHIQVKINPPRQKNIQRTKWQMSANLGEKAYIDITSQNVECERKYNPKKKKRISAKLALKT